MKNKIIYTNVEWFSPTDDPDKNLITSEIIEAKNVCIMWNWAFDNDEEDLDLTMMENSGMEAIWADSIPN